MNEFIDMEVGMESLNEDVDLMPSAPQASSQTPLPLATKKAPSEEGEVVPLNDDLVMDVYNL